ncbi:TetR/AcrR family transcriptional regulator [Polaromonas sp. LjRoot131]|uniref:TetR/AcrR family transcriptional regulator n=1 Tax=Polaromonas sp. LjRoot131 TaxID=3342262 RepID=UPI003ECF65A9
MPKARKIEDEALMEHLGTAFKDFGFEGTSLAMLSEAAGITKSSLYHRFPAGKNQIALEVLYSTRRFLDAEVFPVLLGDASPELRMKSFVASLNTIYASGADSCLLNMLAPPRGQPDECGQEIAAIFNQFLKAIAAVARASGCPAAEARRRAERTLIEIQGSLVLARGIGDSSVFSRMLTRLPTIVLGSHHQP